MTTLRIVSRANLRQWAPWVAGTCAVVMAGTARADIKHGGRMLGSPQDSSSARVEGVGPWAVYRDANVPLDFTFEYPGNWITGAERGRAQPYWQLTILGPRNDADSYTTGITIRKQSTKESGALYKSLQELIQARKQGYAAGPDARTIRDAVRPMGSLQAQDLEFSYVVPLPIDNPAARPTRLQTRIVAFAFGDSLYELTYSADEGDFKTYEPVFTHLLDTLSQ